MPDGSSTAALYRPKLITTFSEGYHFAQFRKDLLAALTVAVVALPLSMAFAIASGVSPERGLYTTIIGGFLVSALGGSRFQIGGPAGAFMAIVAGIVALVPVDDKRWRAGSIRLDRLALKRAPDLLLRLSKAALKVTQCRSGECTDGDQVLLEHSAAATR